MTRTADYDYELPPDRIAQRPAARREDARLLVLDRRGGIQHRHVYDLPDLLRPGDLLVLNDSRVVSARLVGRRSTGGRVDVLLLRPEGTGVWSCLAAPARRLKPGERLHFGDGVVGEVRGKGSDDRWRMAFPEDLRSRLGRIGRAPLPPYIRREPDEEDKERYQTVYARKEGSVAAPTAGLHFTHEILDRLRARGVGIAWITLHVGPGTFQPIRTERVSGHVMEAEDYEVPDASLRGIAAARREGRRIIAVGTTCVRVLETLARGGPSRGRTDLFIHPPFRFRYVDAMLTNFHLPRGTPLLLVCALAGRERILDAYRCAMREGYRFYSYGDAMLIL